MDINIIRTLALWIGLISGTLMLIGSFLVYLKHLKSDLSAVAFPVLGVILIGMSIWTTVELSLPIASFRIINGQINANEKKVETLEKEYEFIWENVLGIEASVNQIKARGVSLKELDKIEKLIRDIKAKRDVIESQFQTIKSTNSATKLMVDSLAQSIGIKTI